MRQVRHRRLGGAGLRQLAVGVLEPGEVAERTVRQHHGSGQLRDEPLHRLAHPPGGVPPERHAAVGLIAVQRAQKAERPLLKQVEAIDRARGTVVARHRRDQRHERLDQLATGVAIARLGALHELALELLGQPRASLETLEILAGGGSAGGTGPPEPSGEVTVERARPSRRRDELLATLRGEQAPAIARRPWIGHGL